MVEKNPLTLTPAEANCQRECREMIRLIMASAMKLTEMQSIVDRKLRAWPWVETRRKIDKIERLISELIDDVETEWRCEPS